MKTIFKYTLDPFVSAVKMPAGAQILTVQAQHGQAQLWAIVDTERPDELREFAVVGTGHPMPDDHGEYVSTFQLPDLGLVFHVFAARPVGDVGASRDEA